MQQITQSISLISITPSLTPLISLTHKLKSKTHIQNPKISAKWGRRRKAGSQRSRKLIINSIAYIATSLKILPEPFDSLVREFWVAGGGNGGNLGFRNGFGGGGGGEGRGRKRDKLGFWVLLLISSSLAFWVILEKEREIDLGFWIFLVFVSAIVVYFLFKGWKKEIKDWVLGFSCGAALMGLSLRNNESFVRWVHQIRANSSSFSIVSKKRRRGNRSFRWI